MTELPVKTPYAKRAFVTVWRRVAGGAAVWCGRSCCLPALPTRKPGFLIGHRRFSRQIFLGQTVLSSGWWGGAGAQSGSGDSKAAFKGSRAGIDIIVVFEMLMDVKEKTFTGFKDGHAF